MAPAIVAMPNTAATSPGPVLTKAVGVVGGVLGGGVTGGVVAVKVALHALLVTLPRLVLIVALTKKLPVEANVYVSGLFWLRAVI